jgi:uncharacterized protein YycO
MPVAFIRLHSGKGFISKLIQFQTWSRYSHASLELYGIVYEAKEFIGTRRFVPKYNSDDVTKVLAVQLTNFQARVMEQFLHNQMGSKYDYAQIVRILARQMQRKSSATRWFCSELVYAAFDAVGIALLREINPCQVTPQHLSLIPDLRAIDVTDKYLDRQRRMNTTK